MDEKALALARQLEKKVERLDREDHFLALGVPRDATLELIHEAHALLRRWFDPARVEDIGLASMRPLAEHIADRLDEARDILSDDELRRAYLLLLEADDRPLEAMHARIRGQRALRAGEWATAQRELARAVELVPTDGEGHALLATAIRRGSKLSVAGVRRGIASALQHGEGSPRVWTLVGEIYLLDGRFDRAAACFSRALRLDDAWLEAERGLRKVRKRRAAVMTGVRSADHQPHRGARRSAES